MSAIAVIGPGDRARGFALAGVTVLAAADAAEARAAWEALPPDTAVVILTAATHAALRAQLEARPSVLAAVLP
jgi:vacuolar-type H+-ATPase subunit F/Vma7